MGLTTAALRLARTGACAGAVVAIAASPVAAAGGTSTGVSSSATPYLVPMADGVEVTSILTVGDQVDGRPLVGIPDGLGILRGDGGTARLFLNHELASGVGAVRAHGANGAFVSEYTLDASTLEVTAGSDLIDQLNAWTGAAYAPATGAALSINRFCSADLPAKSAFWDPASRTGYNGRIFMNGEEAGNEGRAFATLVTGPDKGQAYELPWLGNLSFENAVAAPGAGRTTVVIGLDDSRPGQVYVYAGTKQRTGTPLQRAGLVGGSVYGVRVPSAPTTPKTVGGVSYPASAEDRVTGVGGSSVPFTLAGFGDVSTWTGSTLQDESIKRGATEFLRPEDGAWDPTHRNDFYFVTTDRFDTVQTPTTDGVANTPAAQVGNSRLWRLRFADVSRPALGGTITQLLDGTEGPQMMDNITVDRVGNVVIQEDPGEQAYLARIWSYSITDDTVTPIAQHDPDRFGAVAEDTLTIDEESSGIIDASDILGPGWFIGTVQAHYAIAGELVEGGQLFALYNPASDPTR